jgi:hypothetical protein
MGRENPDMLYKNYREVIWGPVGNTLRNPYVLPVLK